MSESDTRTYGEIFHAEYAAAQRRFMRESREWGDLAPTEQASIQAGATEVAMDALRRPGPEADTEPKPAAQFALVELMGHAQVTGSWRETILCGRPMLEITRLDAAERRVQLVGPDSVYRLTPLTEAEALHVTRFARAAITATTVQDVDDDFASWGGDEDDL